MKIKAIDLLVIVAILAMLVAIVLPVIGTIDTHRRMEQHLPLTAFDRNTVNSRCWENYPLAYGPLVNQKR